MFPRGVTFDDVLLVPGYNGVRSRQAVTTEAQLGKGEARAGGGRRGDARRR